MSKLTKKPTAVPREADNRPVVVQNHNRVAFYVIEPSLFEGLIEEWADHEWDRKALRRMAEKFNAVEVRLEDI